MYRIYMQALKHWQEFRRDSLSISLSFLLPLITLLLFGYGIRLHAHDLKISVHDCSMTSAAREIVERLQATNSLHARVFGNCEYSNALESGDSKAVVLIPSDLERDLLSSKPAALEVLIDGTDIVNGRFVRSAICGAILKVKSSSSELYSKRILYNAGLKESIFVVPGVYGIVLWIFPCLLGCVAIAREREQGSMVQITLSSMSSVEYLLGKWVVYWLLGMGQAFLVLLAGYFLFGIKFLANPLPFIISLPLYLAAAVLFGLSIGAWSKSQTSAVQAVSSLAFFTSLLLSGFIYPLANIPGAFSWISYLVPPRYFIEISRSTFIKGAGWGSCLPDLAIIVSFLVLFALTALLGCHRFKARCYT